MRSLHKIFRKNEGILDGRRRVKHFAHVCCESFRPDRSPKDFLLSSVVTKACNLIVITMEEFVIQEDGQGLGRGLSSYIIHTENDGRSMIDHASRSVELSQCRDQLDGITSTAFT